MWLAWFRKWGLHKAEGLGRPYRGKTVWTMFHLNVGSSFTKPHWACKPPAIIGFLAVDSVDSLSSHADFRMTVASYL